ncbi:MAG: 2-succinyl-6-hydroxy-2,4-cyclohexadiene-1-carboxylate synthase [Ignavibacteriaceae bacterium]
MFIEFESAKINYEFLRPETSNLPYIILLHGFTGSLEDWYQFEKYFSKDYNLVGIDLIGHGKSDSPSELNYYSTASIIRQIKKVKESVTGKKVYLLGYSMGGRAALNYALTLPYDLEALILESATAGIVNPSIKFERERTDRNLAEFILSNPIEKFVDDWMNKEIFRTQKNLSETELNKIRNRKLECDRKGLAYSLLGFGAGVMDSVFDKLPEIRIPVQLICGELDSKFVDINLQMQKKIPNSKLSIIKNSGHNVHLEETKQYADVVYSFAGSF